MHIFIYIYIFMHIFYYYIYYILFMNIFIHYCSIQFNREKDLKMYSVFYRKRCEIFLVLAILITELSKNAGKCSIYG